MRVCERHAHGVPNCPQSKPTIPTITLFVSVSTELVAATLKYGGVMSQDSNPGAATPQSLFHLYEGRAATTGNPYVLRTISNAPANRGKRARMIYADVNDRTQHNRSQMQPLCAQPFRAQSTPVPVPRAPVKPNPSTSRSGYGPAEAAIRNATRGVCNGMIKMSTAGQMSTI